MNKLIREIDEKINNLDTQFQTRKKSFISLKKESKQTIEKLKETSNSIEKYIIEVRNIL